MYNLETYNTQILVAVMNSIPTLCNYKYRVCDVCIQTGTLWKWLLFVATPLPAAAAGF